MGAVRAGGVWVTFGERRELGKWDYRLAFADGGGRRYNLAVTDLAFRYYLDGLRDREGVPPAQAANRLTTQLRRADHLYLRVGLARGWGDGDRAKRCHLQINGVHAFPDYLDGCCFADLAPARVDPYDVSQVPF